jgi:hypothetical protein
LVFILDHLKLGKPKVAGKCHKFQHSLFYKVRTLLSQTKPTLLLKKKCDCTTINTKTQCLQMNESQHCLGKESALEAGGGVERAALIKSLIYVK